MDEIMDEIMDKIMDKILTISTGIYAGLGITLSLVGVPSILCSSDPLPSWNKLYNNGKDIALASTSCGTICAIKLYLDLNDISYLICGVLMFVPGPFTGIFIDPINKQLSKCKRGDREILPLIHRWNGLQWFCTVFGVSAFMYNVFCINSKW